MENDNLGGISHNGVSVFWIKNHFLSELEDCGIDANSTLKEIFGSDKNRKSIIDVMGKECVCPIDGKMGAAIVDCLEGIDNVGPSQLILSCHEENCLKEIAETLWDYCNAKNLNPRETYIWSPFFCDNHHRDVENERETSGYMRSLITSQEKLTLQQQRISSIGKVLVILSPWARPSYFTSLWEIYELYTTIELGCELIIKMSLEERNTFMNHSFQNANELMELFRIIDGAQIQSAKASNPSDKQFLMEYLVHEGPGIERANNIVKKTLRQWAKGEIMKALKVHKKKCKGDSKEKDIADLYSLSGYIFNEVNEYDDALKLYNKALDKYKQLDGDWSTTIGVLKPRIKNLEHIADDLKSCSDDFSGNFSSTKSPPSEDTHIPTRTKTLMMTLGKRQRKKYSPSRFRHL